MDSFRHVERRKPGFGGKASVSGTATATATEGTEDFDLCYLCLLLLENPLTQRFFYPCNQHERTDATSSDRCGARLRSAVRARVVRAMESESRRRRANPAWSTSVGCWVWHRDSCA